MNLRGWILEKLGGNAAGINFVSTGFYNDLQPDYVGGTIKSIALDGYGGNEHVYSALKVYMDKAKVPPYILSKVKSKSKYAKYKAYSATGNPEHLLHVAALKAASIDEIETHELLNLLAKPNSYQTGTQFREDLLGKYKLFGEAFIWMLAPRSGINAGKPKQLYILPNDLVTVNINENDWQNPIAGYTLNVNGRNIALPLEDVIFFYNWHPLERIKGLSPLTPGARLLTKNKSNNEAQAKMYTNGGTAYLISQHATANESLSAENIKLIQQRLDRFRREKTNVLATNGAVDVSKIGDTGHDLGLIDADKNDSANLSVLFGVDPILTGDKSGSTYSNQEQAYKSLVTNTIIPDLLTIEEKLQQQLVWRYGSDLVLQFDTSIYPELAPNLELLATIYGQPLLTENEKRAIFNYDAINMPEMNAIYIKTGYTDITKAGESNENTAPEEEQKPGNEDDNGSANDEENKKP